MFLSFDENGNIKEANWDGSGCAISQASADMLMDKIIGKSMESVGTITEQEIQEMMGIHIGPSREKCAYLTINTLRRLLGEPGFGPT